MPLGTPTYNPAPSGNKRPPGGGRKPRDVTPVPSPMPTPAPTPQPSGNPLRDFRDKVQLYGKGMPGERGGLTYDQLMGLDLTGMGPGPGYTPSTVEQMILANTQAGYRDQAAGAARQTYSQSIMDQFGAWSDSQQDNLLNQFNLGNANATALYDLNNDILSQGRQTDLGLLGERQYRDVDLARQGLNGQIADLSGYQNILSNRIGIRGNQFATDAGYYDTMGNLLTGDRELARDRFVGADAYMEGAQRDNRKQFGFNERGFNQDVAGAQLQRDVTGRAARSDATVRGGGLSAGMRDNIEDIAKQFNLSVDDARLVLDKSNQSVAEQDRQIEQQRRDAGFGYKGQVQGFDKSQAGLERDAMSSLYGFQDDMEGFKKQRLDLNSQGRDLGLQGKALDSLAKEYGIKREDIDNQFKNAVTMLGLDLSQTQQELEQMLNSGNADLVARGMDFMNQMMAYQDGTAPSMYRPPSTPRGGGTSMQVR